MPTDLHAGPELDRLVAEKVMGWRPHARNSAYYVQAGKEHDFIEDVAREIRHWRPSTDIAHAWEVAQVFILQRRGPSMYAPFAHTDEGLKTGDGFTVSIPPPRDREEDIWYSGFGTGETLPLAICRAALKAIAHA